jgi:hypothetical protein
VSHLVTSDEGTLQLRSGHPPTTGTLLVLNQKPFQNLALEGQFSFLIYGKDGGTERTRQYNLE